MKLPKACCLLLAVPLASCIPPSAVPPGMPTGPGYQDESREVNRRGYNLGIRDARLGRAANPLLYNNLYDARTKDDFGRGYMTGYRTIRP